MSLVTFAGYVLSGNALRHRQWYLAEHSIGFGLDGRHYEAAKRDADRMRECRLLSSAGITPAQRERFYMQEEAPQ